MYGLLFKFVFSFTCVLSQDTFFVKLPSSELSEGDVCDRTDDGIWTCQRPRNCPSAVQDLSENRKPKICFYDDRTPIICCRDTKSTTENYISRMRYEEGEVCKDSEEGIWTCQLPKNCPSAIADLKENKRPTICSYNDKTPIICCKEQNIPNKNINTIKSKAACERYQNLCSLHKPPQSRRDDVVLLTLGGVKTAPKEYPHMTNFGPMSEGPLGAVGGVETVPKEYPHMAIFRPMAIGGVKTVPKEYPHMGTHGETRITSSIHFYQFICAILLTELVVGASVFLRSKMDILFYFGHFSGYFRGPIMERITVNKSYHMALIGYGESNSISWSCGGSLISEQYVLSAAHCTYPGIRIGAARWVRLGDLNIATNNDDAKPEEFEIVSTINHPEYRPPALYNDIALYKLNQSVIFSQYILPVCLQSVYEEPYEKVIATGWGRIGPSGPKSKHLMKVTISIVPQDVCSDLVQQKHQLPRGIDEESMICAGEMAGGIDTCQGDSGGPLMLTTPTYACVHQQIGVTSFGRICGSERSPGVYTKVSKFIPWIESIVWPY